MAVLNPANPAVAVQQEARPDKNSHWLRTRRWDLMFITLSVLVVPIPYIMYLVGRDVFGIEDDVSRNMVNAFAAIAIGGPHMMSTFLRTGLDNSFKSRYPMLIRSSIIIPIVVISLAFLNLNLLLTVFFFWASIHVLHQVTYITELYNHKDAKYIRHSAVTLQARAIDYAIILTCLFPIATYKITQGTFFVGVNDLGNALPEFLKQPDQPWPFYMITAIFIAALVAFIMKSVREYRLGILNWPKTAFIGITVAVAFVTPLLPNLDTAFQGLNFWHSFQYLAITFFIIKIRQMYGNLDKEAPMVSRFSRKTKNATGLYMLSVVMLGGSAVIFIIVYALSGLLDPQISGNLQFDRAYYTAILSFLWIHYYHDHFLFTDFESLDAAYGEA